MVSDNSRRASQQGIGSHEPCTVYHKKIQFPKVEKPFLELKSPSPINVVAGRCTVIKPKVGHRQPKLCSRSLNFISYKLFANIVHADLLLVSLELTYCAWGPRIRTKTYAISACIAFFSDSQLSKLHWSNQTSFAEGKTKYVLFI